MGYHLTPIRRIIVNNKIASVGEAVEKKKPSFTAGGNVNWNSHYAKQYGGFSKN